MTSTRLLAAALALALAGCARHGGGVTGLAGAIGLPVFETRAEIATGLVEHSDFAAGDFDGDGRVDLAVVDFDGELQLMLGNGGVFATGQRLALGAGYPFWLERGDFDRDGDLDLAVLQKHGAAVRILRNQGNAEFVAGPLFAIGDNSLQVLATDRNGDGLLDLLVTQIGSPQVGVLLGNGAGQFTAGAPIVVPGEGQAFTLAVGDPTGDGRPDLVVCDPALARVLVYPGRATGGFGGLPTILPVGEVPTWCALGDVSGDGRTDLVVSAFAGRGLLAITGFPTVVGVVAYDAMTISLSVHPGTASLGDVTGDGRLDVVCGAIDQPLVMVVPASATGGFETPQWLDATGAPARIALADVDGNGRSDVVAMAAFGSRLGLWRARANGTLVGARSHATGLQGGGLAVAADFDRNGAIEVLAGSAADSRLAVLRGQGLALATVAFVDLGAPPQQLRLADLDADGRSDVVVTVQNGVKVLRNRSSPAGLVFDVLPARDRVFGAGTAMLGATAVDLDRDGRLDLAAVDFAAGHLQVLRGGASPFAFGPVASHVAVGGNPLDVVAGEFTGDGILDLAVTRSALADVVVLRNDGAGRLTLAAALPVGQAPNWLWAGDLDRNGSSDLVVANGDDDTVSVLLGGGVFTTTAYPAGDLPSALAVTDLTGDLWPDVLVAAGQGQDFRVLVNDGAGGFGSTFAFPGRLGASALALADLDGDGAADLVLGSVFGDRLTVVRRIRN